MKKCFAFHCIGAFPQWKPLTSGVGLLGLWVLLKQSHLGCGIFNVKSEEEAMDGAKGCLWRKLYKDPVDYAYHESVAVVTNMLPLVS